MIETSLAYLRSDAALTSLAQSIYMPKWDSPWWHMVLLHELGVADQIPRRVIDAMVAGLDASSRDLDAETSDAFVPCHCALGCMAQVLDAHDIVMPWFEAWFVRYQMADGGLNCDASAYAVVGECPSSMVGTVPALEAMLLGDPARWSPARRAFVDRAAQCVIDRAFVRGSSTKYNAEERDTAPSWQLLAFPRFYFYDVLRGMAAVARWAELTGGAVPAEIWIDLPDKLAVQRDALAHVTRPTSRFPLLDEVSRIGARSEPLTRQWRETKARIARSRRAAAR
ncbi:MAG TPA: hypothetical protein VGL61_00360 [Kofleriaceae bacterium]